MSDARWVEIEGDFQAACAHFAAAAELFDAGGFDEPGMDGYKASMALMHAMQSGHTSLESGLVRILHLLGEERPQGEFWHRDLLRRVCMPVGDRGAVLPPDICEHADETRRFRNVATRNYDRFQLDAAEIAIASARVLAEELPECLRVFRNRIDPPESNGSGGAARSGPT